MTLYRNYVAHNKEVLRDGRHVADACDTETAALIAEALNHAPACCDPVRPHGGTPEPSPWFEPTYDTDELTDPLRDMIVNPAIVIDAKHHVQRQGDEYACKCGTRWSVSDGEEHP